MSLIILLLILRFLYLKIRMVLLKMYRDTVRYETTSGYDANRRLWEPGHKERYYEQKFHVDYHEDIEFRQKYTLFHTPNCSLAKHYVEGFCWVLLYYYQGCPSWTWYFPYHFAPFASDFQDIATLDIKFEKGQPFKPAEQLMGVLPAASRTLLPEAFQPLMVDEDSSIIDFYPEDFQIDMNGKKMIMAG